MGKDILPVISDEAAVRTWRKQLLVALALVSFFSTSAMALLAVALCRKLVDDTIMLLILCGGAIFISIVTTSIASYACLKALDNARTRMHSARRFLQDAGHELATPVAILSAKILVMERQLGSDETFNDHINVLSESTRRLSCLVDDMRALARAEAPRDVSDLSIINLEVLTRSISMQMIDVCAERSITITLETQPHATIIGDYNGVERSLSNLLSNAVRYSRPGGKVAVTIKQTSNKIIMTIEDNGIGIPAEDLPKIFDRFYRAENGESETPGSGLGLAIVKAVVESHSGKVYAESEVGSFTRFIVELPRSPVHPIMKILQNKT